MDKELHRIAITCIIHKDGTFLLTKRSPDKKVHPNKWTIPGGGLSTDDYANEPSSHGDAGWYAVVEKALAREIAEEVGVKIGDAKQLLNMAFIRPDNIPVLVLTYHAPYVSGDVILDKDSTEYAWVTLEEAKALDIIPGIYDELVMVDKILKN